MYKAKSPLTKSNLILLFTVFTAFTLFCYFGAFEQNMTSFINALKISTNIFLIPVLIGWYLIKWAFELIINFMNIFSNE